MTWSLILILLISNFDFINFIQQCFCALYFWNYRSFWSFFNLSCDLDILVRPNGLKSSAIGIAVRFLAPSATLPIFPVFFPYIVYGREFPITSWHRLEFALMNFNILILIHVHLLHWLKHRWSAPCLHNSLRGPGQKGLVLPHLSSP